MLDRPDAPVAVQRIFCVAAKWSIRRWERICGYPVEPDDLEPMTRTMMEVAERISGADFLDLIETAQLIGRSTAGWHEQGFDVLVMASTPDVAPPLGTLQAADDTDVRRATKALMPLASLLGWCNLTGQPAISLPLGVSATGLSISSSSSPPMATKIACSPSQLNSKPPHPGAAASHQTRRHRRADNPTGHRPPRRSNQEPPLAITYPAGAVKSIGPRPRLRPAVGRDVRSATNDRFSLLSGRLGCERGFPLTHLIRVSVRVSSMPRRFRWRSPYRRPPTRRPARCVPDGREPEGR